MYYRLGLDIGITSVGWAVIEDDESGNPIRIIDLGSRIFDVAEVPKTGAPLAEARRIARGTRRRNRRKVHRIERTKDILIRYGLITKEKLDNLYNQKGKNVTDVYTLRAAALDRKLSDDELSRILINLVKKRGYKSNSRAEELTSNDSQKALNAISDNKKIMKEKGYRTVAEMYLRDSKFKLKTEDGENICNSNGIPIIKLRNSTDDYKTTVERSLLLDEIKMILESQKRFNDKISDEFIQEYINIFSSQRNYDEGPAFPSKYGGSLIENMLGNCTFEENEKRAAKATYTFELFKLLQDFNSIKLQKLNLTKSAKGNFYHKSEETRSLSDEEKTLLLEKFKSTDKISISTIRKDLKIPYDEVFNLIDYDFRILNNNIDSNIKEVIDEIEKNAKKQLVEFKSFHDMRRALDKVEKGYIYNFSQDEIDNIATILSIYKTDEKRKKYLNEIGIDNEVIEALLSLSFSKFSHLSIKAMKKIIPFLKEGLTYDKAVNAVYEDFRGKVNTEKKSKLSLNDIEEISNPVVRRAVSQTIKVINAITLKYGKPDLINVELAREVSKNFTERKQLEKKMIENMSQNEKYLNEIKELGLKSNITGQDIVKYKLWKEQNEISPYSGKVITPQMVFAKDTDVDHIIPYSVCFDDSYNNKVLVLSSENRMKTNRTPYEYISESGQDVDEYIVRIENMYSSNKKKKKNLLKEHYTEEDEANWKERNIKDTQYITKVILNLIRTQLKFKEDRPINSYKRAMAVNGKITKKIRTRLGLEKVREGDKHHAMDAAVIAITTEKMIQMITNYQKNIETRYSGLSMNKEEYYESFPMPYENFELELKARLMDTDEEVEMALRKLNILEYKLNGYPKSIFVSKMPKRKITGSAHKETIASLSKDGKIVEKKDLKLLKLKDGEIEGYHNKQDDTLLYNALKERLIKYNGKAEEAFKEPFFKPRREGSLGPLVKKVKIESTSSLNVKLEKMNGVAGNGDTVRIDVFYVENEGYYFVPIYVSDTVKNELPNKAPVPNKPYSEWKEMKDENFIFSVYPSDLIYVKSRTGINLAPMNKDSKRENITVNEMLGYYIKCGISTASIALSTNERVYWQPSLGIKTLLEFKKYEVDVLGNYHEVKLPEKRMKFNFKK